jgi:hypothetical protein
MPKKPSLTVIQPGQEPASSPPPSLGEAGRTMWQSIQNEYAIMDSGGLAMLAQACASADRAADCAAIIAEQGAVISSKSGLRDHPLIRHEIASRGLCCRIIARLGLDLEPLQHRVGRPAGAIGWRPDYDK